MAYNAEYAKQYRKDNTDKLRQYELDYKDRRKELNALYYLNNKDRILRRKKERTNEHKRNALDQEG